MRRNLVKVFLALAVCLAMAAPCASAEEAPGGVSAGNVVGFGRYEQDRNRENGPEPLQWIVLEAQDGKALLLSRYGLEGKPFHKDFDDTSWENCSLRAWLNDDFLNRAFDGEEQAAILLTDVDNSAAQEHSDLEVGDQNATQDRVFLLSYAEASRCLGRIDAGWGSETLNNPKARMTPTPYALSKSVTRITEDSTAYGMWWLRSPETVDGHASAITNGYLLTVYADDKHVCVRPVIRVDLQAAGSLLSVLEEQAPELADPEPEEEETEPETAEGEEPAAEAEAPAEAEEAETAAETPAEAAEPEPAAEAEAPADAEETEPAAELPAEAEETVPEVEVPAETVEPEPAAQASAEGEETAPSEQEAEPAPEEDETRKAEELLGAEVEEDETVLNPGEAESEEKQVLFRVTTKKATNVREAPDKNSRRVEQLTKKGITLPVTEVTKGADGKDWYKLLLEDGREGYARYDFFVKENE